MTDLGNLYRGMNEQIVPSDLLLEKTKRKMRASRPVPLYRYAAAAACLVLLVAAIRLFPLDTHPFSGDSAGGAAPSTGNGAAADLESSPLMGATPEAAGAPEVPSAAPRAALQSFVGILTPLTPGEFTPEVEVTSGMLHFNKLESVNKTDFSTNPDKEAQTWTQEQVFEYLGKDPRPAQIPNDLVFIGGENSQYTVFLEKNGEVAWDSFDFTYLAPSDQDYDPLRRSLNVSVSKGKLPLTDTVIDFDKAQESTLNGISLHLGYSAVEYGPYDEKTKEAAGTFDEYVAEFMKDGIGYRIISQNLTQEEFIHALLSIVS